MTDLLRAVVHLEATIAHLVEAGYTEDAEALRDIRALLVRRLATEEAEGIMEVME